MDGGGVRSVDVRHCHDREPVVQVAQLRFVVDQRVQGGRLLRVGDLWVPTVWPHALDRAAEKCFDGFPYAR